MEHDDTAAEATFGPFDAGDSIVNWEKVAPLPTPDRLAECGTVADVRISTSLSNPRARDIDDNDRGNRSNSGDDEDEGLPPARRRRPLPRGKSISRCSLKAQQGNIVNECHDRITYGPDLDTLDEEGDEKEEEQVQREVEDEDEDDEDYIDVDDDDDDEGSQCVKGQKLGSPTHRDIALKDSPTHCFQLSHRSPSTSSADESDHVQSLNHNERLSSPSSSRRSPICEVLPDTLFDVDVASTMTSDANTACRGLPASLQIRTSGSTTFHTFIVQQGHLPPTPSVNPFQSEKTGILNKRPKTASNQGRRSEPPALARCKGSKFTSKEDVMLVNLKENRGFSWNEIKPFFPNRSKETLQVRYCTKLKNGARVARKRGRR